MSHSNERSSSHASLHCDLVEREHDLIREVSIDLEDNAHSLHQEPWPERARRLRGAALGVEQAFFLAGISPDEAGETWMTPSRPDHSALAEALQSRVLEGPGVWRLAIKVLEEASEA